MVTEYQSGQPCNPIEANLYSNELRKEDGEDKQNNDLQVLSNIYPVRTRVAEDAAFVRSDIDSKDHSMKLLPYFLRPSATQRSCHHHPWLDFRPDLQVRDDLIRAQERYDEDELCSDILGFWNLNATDNMLLVRSGPRKGRRPKVLQRNGDGPFTAAQRFCNISVIGELKELRISSFATYKRAAVYASRRSRGAYPKPLSSTIIPRIIFQTTTCSP
ncbi:hypothetical protein AFLA_005918 [Aspergillus flavus NRRL3357]|nr:hypothetical protein AFLA_005918 [Aspergillus flavus NRRL3357]